MKPSPIGSKLFAGYAVLFVGLAPVGLAAMAIANGVGLTVAPNLALGAAVVYFGVRVFAGDERAVKMFAVLVIISYLSLTATNLAAFDDFPTGSRAKQMAVPRMIRGVLFAAVYAWYFLLPRKTMEGFRVASPPG